jgi:hypothetical protein
MPNAQCRMPNAECPMPSPPLGGAFPGPVFSSCFIPSFSPRFLHRLDAPPSPRRRGLRSSPRRLLTCFSPHTFSPPPPHTTSRLLLRAATSHQLLPTQLLPFFPAAEPRGSIAGGRRAAAPPVIAPHPRAPRSGAGVPPNAECRMPNAECPMPSSSLAFALMGRGLSRPRPLSARTPMRAQTRPSKPTLSHDSKIILSLESQPQPHVRPPMRTRLRAHP